MSDNSWTPPEKPDPSKILDDARSDTRQGKYALALLKHLWVHQHALEHDRYFSAVRLSFGLAYWLELASKYAPAMQALLQTRDAAEQACRNLGFQFPDFQEATAINRWLGNSLRNTELFEEASQTNPQAAQLLYHIAEPYLIKCEKYSLCGQFLLDPQTRISQAIMLYQLDLIHEENSPASSFIPKTALASFINKVTTIVALLVLNARQNEANEVCKQALEVLDEPWFRTRLDAALSGKLPRTDL